MPKKWTFMRHGVDGRWHSHMLSGYMGKSDMFDQALADFSVTYADQNERDHAELDKAVRSGKVKAVFEESR